MKKFTEFEISLIACYFIMLGMSMLMISNLEKQLEEQEYINNQLKTEYETLKINYDDLDIDLHQQLRECENKFDDTKYDRYDLNRDGKVSPADYVQIKNQRF